VFSCKVIESSILCLKYTIGQYLVSITFLYGLRISKCIEIRSEPIGTQSSFVKHVKNIEHTILKRSTEPRTSKSRAGKITRTDDHHKLSKTALSSIT
jgi:hypothetical protein